MTVAGIGAVVLAAGKGNRIGIAKLRLMTGGETYLARSVRILSGASPVVCIVSPEEAAWAMAAVPHARIITASSQAGAMLSSVQLGVEALISCYGAIILPVDHPAVQERTVGRLIEAGLRGTDAVVKPFYRDRAGHPILVPRSIFPAILSAPAQRTLREVIAMSGIRVDRVEVDDPGVLKNVNTLTDLPHAQSPETEP